MAGGGPKLGRVGITTGPRPCFETRRGGISPTGNCLTHSRTARGHQIVNGAGGGCDGGAGRFRGSGEREAGRLCWTGLAGGNTNSTFLAMFPVESLCLAEDPAGFRYFGCFFLALLRSIEKGFLLIIVTMFLLINLSTSICMCRRLMTAVNVITLFSRNAMAGKSHR